MDFAKFIPDMCTTIFLFENVNSGSVNFIALFFHRMLAPFMHVHVHTVAIYKSYFIGLLDLL